MRTLLKSSFTWQFAGGFVIGAVGLLTLQPMATDVPMEKPAAATISR